MEKGAVNLDQLRKICPYSAGHAPVFIDALNAAMTEFEISTATRQAAFIAQVAHETAEFQYLREICSGIQYEPGTELGKALGNTEPGDGPRYKGGGFLQLTGRANYDRCGKALNVDLIANPSLIEVPAYAARSGAWFWAESGLNRFADLDMFGSITKKINGGYTGLDHRLSYWLAARKQLGL